MLSNSIKFCQSGTLLEFLIKCPLMDSFLNLKIEFDFNPVNIENLLREPIINLTQPLV